MSSEWIQDGDFAIDQDIDRKQAREMTRRTARARLRMMNMRTSLKFWQHAQGGEATDRAPANKCDESVGGLGLGAMSLGAARCICVVAGSEQATALVPVLVPGVAAPGDRAPAAPLRRARRRRADSAWARG